MTSGKNTAWLVCGTALFALLVILIFKPFNSYAWADYHFWLFTGYALMVVLSGMGVIAISHTLMHFYTRKKDISLAWYSVWLIIELASMAVIFTCIAIVFGEQNNWQDFGDIYEKALIYASLILLIPYSFFTLGFSLKDKSEQLRLMQQQAEEELHEPILISEDDMINFRDEKGELKMSIRAKAIYYIESADNYVTIHYRSAGRMQRYILRQSLKNIEAEYADKDLLRCHRSYIVNFNKIHLLQKTDEGLVLDFDDEKIKPIPVSKTYSQRILMRFTDEAKEQ